MSMQLVERALISRNWNPKTGNQGQYYLIFPNVNVEFIAGKVLLVCSGTFDVVPEQHLSRAIFLCNKYNQAYYYPTVYVDIQEGEGQKRIAFLSCQHAYDLQMGIHLEGLSQLLGRFVGGALNVRDWLAKEPEFWGDPDSWVGRRV
jgi:hypothetical protein